MENKSYEEDFRIIWAAIDGAKNPIDKITGITTTPIP